MDEFLKRVWKVTNVKFDYKWFILETVFVNNLQSEFILEVNSVHFFFPVDISISCNSKLHWFAHFGACNYE